MLVLTLFGISVILGVIGGVSWRLIEDWQERQPTDNTKQP